MKTYTIVDREINIDWRRLMTSSFEDFTKKAEAFLEEHITEYLKRNFMCGHKCLHLFFHHFYPIPLFQPNITCHAHHGNYILVYRV